jgi:hypothetical protein
MLDVSALILVDAFAADSLLKGMLVLERPLLAIRNVWMFGFRVTPL